MRRTPSNAIIGAAALVLGGMMASCSDLPTSETETTRPAAMTAVAAVPGSLNSGVDWTAPSQVVFVTAFFAPTTVTSSVSAVDPSTGVVRTITPNLAAAQCRDQSRAVVSPAQMPPGQHGLGVYCSGHSSTYDSNYLMRFTDVDYQQGEVVRGFRAAGGLGEPEQRIDPNAISMRADGTTMFWAGNSICEELWVSRGDHVEPFAVELGSGSRRWDNAQAARDRLQDFTTNCIDVGSASDPTFSPDGRRIAFLASPDKIGLTGAAAADAPFGLYWMDFPSGTPQQIGPKLHGANSLRWAPGADQIAVATSTGTYLIGLDGQQTQLRSDACAIAWSPDDTQIALACPGSTTPATTELFIQPAPT